MTDEYKKYDSQDSYNCHNARLTKDATVTPGNKGDMVRITFVSTCRSDRYSDLWIEANVSDFNAPMAAFLKKGDVVGVSGKPGLRKYDDKDGNERISFEIVRAEVHPSIPLFQALKERGFTPGEAKSTAKKPVGTKLRAEKAKKVVEIPDDDDSPGE